MHPMLYTATKAIRSAGNFIATKYDFYNHFTNNSINKNYLINTIKKTAETIMITIIHQSYPNHIVHTINNNINTTNNTTQWIINILDNKINFLKKMPSFSLSIAVRINNNTEIATIYNPINNELFTAARGYGAQLNNYRLRINNNIISDILIISIDINSKNCNNIIKLHKYAINKILKQFINYRCTGSDNLDLAYVAAGRIDCFIRIYINSLNYYAGELLIKEAGGRTANIMKLIHHSNMNIFIAGNQDLVNLLTQYKY